MRALFRTLAMLCLYTVVVCVAQAQVGGRRAAQPPVDPAQAAQAYWIDRATLLIPRNRMIAGASYTLFSDAEAKLVISGSSVSGGSALPLTIGTELTSEQRLRYPALATNYGVIKLPQDLSAEKLLDLLRSQLQLGVRSADGQSTYTTGLQIAGVLDDLYAYNGTLGVVIRRAGASRDDWNDFPDDAAGAVKIKVWAPTARTMRLLLFEKPDEQAPTLTVAMHEHAGVWVAMLDPRWIGKYYLFDETVYAPSKHAIVEHRVSDPYSIDLALNGTMSRLTDVEAEPNKPHGWATDASPKFARPNDLSIYELHVRDFSIDDRTVPPAHRGTYEAFTERRSDGMKHLRLLAQAGLKAVHLLPTFHFGGVNEDKTMWQTTADLTSFPPAGEQQQAAVAAIRSRDGFGWGYNPIHYLAPEGAYAVDPSNRVREYREMVMALHSTGLRVIQDVVFNHTSGTGEAADALLDKLVPGYYLRLDADGRVFTASCCSDTASEHRMMGKLQQDAIVWNAKHYRIDGFRFDLMGFTFVENLAGIRQALNRLTLKQDGVDGLQIYLYGEGWEFGEIAHNALGISATQQNLYGTGVGSFNDRLRDGMRGGGATGEPRPQGFATGLFTDPSEYTAGKFTAADQRRSLLEEEDWIRIGMTGNLREFKLVDASGEERRGGEIRYHNSPTGYTAAPSESINYVSLHDNQDLFDIVQIKSAASDSAAMRERRAVLAMSVVALGQGIPLFMAGDDLLRSKSMDTDSYDSGDWFNRIDWSMQTNHWGQGLPMERQNSKDWSVERSLLENPALKPGSDLIRASAAAFQELLRIRYSSPLFRLPTAAEITQKVHFLNTGPGQIPGLIVMSIVDTSKGAGPYQRVVVVVNASIQEQSFSSDALRGPSLHLHPQQQHSADPVVRTAHADGQSNTLTVPALTTAVFVSER
jgi:pullulanase